MELCKFSDDTMCLAQWLGTKENLSIMSTCVLPPKAIFALIKKAIKAKTDSQRKGRRRRKKTVYPLPTEKHHLTIKGHNKHFRRCKQEPKHDGTEPSRMLRGQIKMVSIAQVARIEWQSQEVEQHPARYSQNVLSNLEDKHDKSKQQH